MIVRWAMALARAPAVRSWIIKPVSPWRTMSRGPATSKPITGNPDAIASSMTLPKVSVSDGKTKNSPAA
jgi:hypothetical protein